MVQTLTRAVRTVLPAEARMRFQLAVSEALTNLALHAETNHSKGVVRIVLSLGGQTAEVQVFDPDGAERFDPCVPAPRLSEVDPLSEKGRGLGLIAFCADDLSYGPVEGRRRLRLSFAARPAADLSA